MFVGVLSSVLLAEFVFWVCVLDFKGKSCVSGVRLCEFAEAVFCVLIPCAVDFGGKFCIEFVGKVCCCCKLLGVCVTLSRGAFTGCVEKAITGLRVNVFAAECTECRCCAEGTF